MKEINLEMKMTYEDMVRYIRENYEIEEPTIFKFIKIVETNAKMRRLKKYKDIYKYETEGIIKLNYNNHKENLFKKVCLPKASYGFTKEDFERLGVD